MLSGQNYLKAWQWAKSVMQDCFVRAGNTALLVIGKGHVG